MIDLLPANMTGAVTLLWAELSAYSVPELAAVLASLLYIVLAARNSRYCWPPALFASIIFTIVLWQHQLLMDALLNAYYAAMAVYGWISWRAMDSAMDSAMDNAIDRADEQLPAAAQYHRMPLSQHVLALPVIVALSLLSGYWLSAHTDAAFPYLDSLTTWASLFATWLLAKRVIETWIYWIAIDSLCIYLYLNKELYFTAALFAVYTAMAVYALSHWRLQGRIQAPTAPISATGSQAAGEAAS